jgi:prolyl oligopeptidase
MSPAVSPTALPTITPAYPPTATGSHSDTRHGVIVADPYRWLENDVRSDADVALWVAGQNAVTDAYLAALPRRDAIKARLTTLWNYERFGVPRVRGDRQFYARNSGLQNQAVLHVAAVDGTDARVLIDPNLWAGDGATALAEWEPSHDGRYLAYAIQDGGSDWRTIKVRDVATGADLPDTVEWAKFTAIAWAHAHTPDGTGFYYSRFAAPPPGEIFQSANLDQQLCFHALGTPQSADRLVYATPDRPRLGHGAEISDDGRWLVITSAEGTDDRFEISVADLTEGEAPRRLIPGLDHSWRLAGTRGTTLYFVTDKAAPRQRLVAIDAHGAALTEGDAHGAALTQGDAHRAALTEIVAQGSATITAASLHGDRFTVASLADARSVIGLHALDGTPLGTVPLPGIGSADGFASSDGAITHFAFSSFATPASIWRYDAASNTATPLRTPSVAFDPADYSVSQLFFASKDGTRVPMFVSHRKDLDPARPHPTLLYGYGGFNIALTPEFSVARLAWMAMGGVLAIANLRGGGEYGADWHDAGRLAKKQNVFDDFIAAGEALIARGLTTPAQLAIQGGSNGGLLVAAVTNQRPDLFAAALPAVGVMDMLRFNRFTAGRYWTDDYGDPADAAAFQTLLAYSPYHNIRAGTSYPAILVTTADTDDRVVPGHSFKYAAALQAARLGDKPHLIRIETRAGHGSGKPTSKQIAEAADLWAFAGYWTGLTR